MVIPVALLAMLLVQEGPGNRIPAQRLAPAEVRPEDRCTVEGSVYNARTNEPVRKAQVTLVRLEPGDFNPLGAFTDTAGHFSLTGVDPGRYRLVVWRTGYARPEAERRKPGESPPMITLTPRQALKDLVFKLSPAAVIAGRVLDEDGDTVTSAQVQALRYRYLQGSRQLTPGGYATTDDQGNYRMHSLPAGRYVLKVSHPEQRAMLGFVAADSAAADEAYAGMYYPGVLDAGQAVAVQVKEGEERRGIDFRLVPVRTVRVRGRLTNTPGGRGRGVMVGLLPRQNSAYIMERSFASVKPDGAFELRGVVPGSYLITAQYADRDHQFSARRPIEVGNANVENVELTLRPGAELNGQVTLDGTTDKVSLEQVRIGLRDSGPDFSGRPVDAVQSDGSFKISGISDGDYRVTAFSLPPDCYLKSARLNGVDVLENSLTVSEGAVAGKLDIVVSTAGGKLDGSVSNDKHEPAIGVTVALVPDDKPGRSDLFRGTQTDQNGRFNLRGLPPGDYVLYAWEDVEQGAWEDPAFLEQYKDKGKHITIGERTQQSVDLTVIPAGDEGKS